MTEGPSLRPMSASFARGEATARRPTLKERSRGHAASSGKAANRPSIELHDSDASSSHASATSQRGGDPAVNRNNRARHVRTGSRSEEDGRTGYVVASPYARERRHRRELIAHTFERLFHHPALERP